MASKLAHVVFAAALMVGVVAMHSVGHGGDRHGTTVAVAHAAHDGRAQEAGTVPGDEETDPFSLMGMFGIMVCGAVVARFIAECLRPARWFRLWDLPGTRADRIGPESPRFRLRPPRLKPTGLRLNRIAVLRI
ncbi:hypothetical protein L0U85_19435 [Glycomyces sp. L485]|uniref:hypothetical protein n=1 Tax=Glycomyces sp. L485 TaxID=2909235 RepID=UPI001F4A31DC|nr:hypothetical protein [Glycomyces sp. L485]MCH7233010.1 hypothetical protein [Glycomyces sp. L485]